METNLAGKTALVCGGSMGLGLATAVELALLGATIILVSRNEENLTKAAKVLDTSAHQTHQYLVADLSNPAITKSIVESWISQNGNIHVLINNAGGPPSGLLIETNADDLEKAFTTHLLTSHLLVQLLLPGMRQAGYGRILNILSTSVKQPINGLGISNTVRPAVANWAKTLANEIGYGGITVNNILPGYTRTDRLQYLFSMQATQKAVDIKTIENNIVENIPAKRLGEPGEFGAVAAFLCSPAASYINGANISVDGGRTGSL